MLDKKKNKQNDNKSKTYVVCFLILAIMVLGVCYLMLNSRKNSTFGFSVDKNGCVKVSMSTVQQNNTNELIEESIENKRTPNTLN